MKIYLVRHGQTDWNYQKKIQGQQDVDINEQGIRQAEKLAEILKNVPFEYAVCSPLTRAHHTAEILLKYHSHNGAGAGTYRVTIEEPFGIPYGCLVSADIPNLMMAGRDISVDAITFGSTRIMNECMAVGQAAGEAAAMAIASHCEPEKVDVAELRRHLLEEKAILSV